MFKKLSENDHYCAANNVIAWIFCITFLFFTINIKAFCDESTIPVLESFPSVKGETSYNGKGNTIAICGGSGSMNYSIGQAQSPYSYLINEMNEAVDYPTGSLSLCQTDLYLPGKAGLDITIKRIYNTKMNSADPIWKSSHEEQSGFWAGFGWNFSIGAKCIAIEYDYYGINYPYEGYEVGEEDKKEDLIVVSMPGGGFYSFNSRKYNVLDPDEAYYINAENGVGEDEAVLVKDGDTFVLTIQNGITYKFEKQYYMNSKKFYILVPHYCPPGHYCIMVMENLDIMKYGISGYYLGEITDKDGNRITYMYDHFAGEQHIQKYEGDSGGIETTETTGWFPVRPEKIIDSLGREIKFGYSTDNQNSENADCSISSQITNITYKDSAGNPVHYQYTYNKEHGYLEEVIPPNGKKITFTYEFRTKNDDDGSFLLNSVSFPTGAVSGYFYDSISCNDINDFCITKVEKNNGVGARYEYILDEGYSIDKDAIFFKQATVTNQDDETTTWILQDGKLTKTINARGDKVQYEYEGNRIKKEYPERASLCRCIDVGSPWRLDSHLYIWDYEFHTFGKAGDKLWGINRQRTQEQNNGLSCGF